MERAVVDYYQDAWNDWVAELACGHSLHCRTVPPGQHQGWVFEETGRAAKLATPLNCPFCDRGEMPEGLSFIRSGLEWTEQTVPQRLLRCHRLGRGTWGRITVSAGKLRFTMSAQPPVEVVLGPGSNQAVPPEVDHEMQPLGPVSFTIDFFAIDRQQMVRHPTRVGSVCGEEPEDGSASR